MKQHTLTNSNNNKERLSAIVNRITYHNPDNGYSILRVNPSNSPLNQETVIVHQTKVFAGATMNFIGYWTNHPKFGRQFQANEAFEIKPATTAALEKYLGSGLISGVGPKTAKRIVNHFGKSTLEIFENKIEQLTEVPGIAKKKLQQIESAWIEHKSIREVMMFLQSHGLSTLFAVRIYKQYKDDAIKLVSENPYRLASDFYGIGFFSADQIALSIGIKPTSSQRIIAAIKHVLSAAKDFGHCYLTKPQIHQQVTDLLKIDLSSAQIVDLLSLMEHDGLIMVREIGCSVNQKETCYYSKSLYFDELFIAKKVSNQFNIPAIDQESVDKWLKRYCSSKNITLSPSQLKAVKGIVGKNFSVLSGGPGCGKTTTTNIIVKLLQFINKKVLMAAPTGRAAQRMTEVIGQEAKTIHRLLEWQLGKFNKNQHSPLETDFLIIDECSMLDVTLAASLLKATPAQCQILFIGDPDQLPSVGAGNVLKDIIASKKVPCFHLNEIFRQAKQSTIIKYAHQINKGIMPQIESPFNQPSIWQEKTDCIFLDSDEATKEQIHFVNKVKRAQNIATQDLANNSQYNKTNLFEFRTNEKVIPYESEISIPKKFSHVNIDEVCNSKNHIEELLAVLKKVHPWSSLHYGLSATEIVTKLYTNWVPKYNAGSEIQILSPMTRGTLGTVNLNRIVQSSANPASEGKKQLQIGEKLFREGDRVIHRRNNYDLGVFNGDIGVIDTIDNQEVSCVVSFFPDNRQVLYQKDNIVELDLAYAITIHKSQGSEFEVVIIPILAQHFKMLFKNLIYTGLTRAKKLAVFVGTRKALAMAVHNQDTSLRQTALQELIGSNM